MEAFLEGGENMILAANIKRYRDERDMSQDALARVTELTTTTIGNIEQGRVPNPGIDTVKRIADGLGVTVDDLLSDSETAVKHDNISG